MKAELKVEGCDPRPLVEAAPQGSMSALGPRPGRLEEVLQNAQLQQHLATAQEWCKRESHSTLDEVLDKLDCLGAALKLNEVEKRRLVEAASLAPAAREESSASTLLIHAFRIEGAATSPHAEAVALLQAILWAHSLLNQFRYLAEAHFHFWGDSIGPGHFASGDWLPKAHLKEVNASRGTYQAKLQLAPCQSSFWLPLERVC